MGESPKPVIPSFWQAAVFEPLTQLDTQEDVPTIVVDAVDEVNQAIEEDEVGFPVPRLPSQTPRQCPVRVVKCSTPFWEKWLRDSKRSWRHSPVRTQLI